MLFYKEIPFYCRKIESKLEVLCSEKAQENYEYLLERSKEDGFFAARTHVGNRQGLSIHIAIRAESDLKCEKSENYKIIFTLGVIRKWLSLAGLFTSVIALCLLYWLLIYKSEGGHATLWYVFIWLALIFIASIYSTIDFEVQKKYYRDVIYGILDARPLVKEK